MVKEKDMKDFIKDLAELCEILEQESGMPVEIFTEEIPVIKGGGETTPPKKGHLRLVY
jgi:hypothetical protein